MTDKNNKKYEVEIKFKALLNDPKRLFGWVFPYFFFIILLIGIFYVHNMNRISTNTVPVPMIEESTARPSLEVKKGVVTEPVDLDIIQNPPQELIDTGRDLYSSNCASCHGDDGLGNGPAGTALNPQPRNLTTTEEWTNGRKFIEMYKTLEEGIVENGMSAYEYIPPKDRIGIIHYVRTFAEFPEITDEEVQELKSTYNLTEGKQTANQIPVNMAMDRLMHESFNENKVFQLVDYINNHPNEEGYGVFDKVVDNKKRVLSVFYNFDLSDYDKFVTIIENNSLELGFKADVNKINNNEMRMLFEYMNKIVSMVQG